MERLNKSAIGGLYLVCASHLFSHTKTICTCHDGFGLCKEYILIRNSNCNFEVIPCLTLSLSLPPHLPYRASTSSASGTAGTGSSRRSTFTSAGSKGSTAGGGGRKASGRHDRQTGHGTDDSLPDDDED